MPKFRDLTGQQFGNLVVLERAENLILKSGKSRTRWKCKCNCGNEVVVSGQTLTQGTTVSCGCYGKERRLESRTPKDLTGQKFGRLTVIEFAESVKVKNGTKIKWKCKCDCGNEVVAYASQLASGKTKSCGCLKRDLIIENKRIDLTGMKFGKLTVIKNLPSKKYGNSTFSNWLCRCDCGNVAEVTGRKLRNGETVSCGCAKFILDLSGKKFGCLEILNRDPDDHSKWICKCECGKITSKYGGHIVSGTTISCGCKARSVNEAIISTFLDNHAISYYPEYSFDNLRRPETNGLLRFDFAITDISDTIIALIEYQGPQHYLDLGEFGKMQREETDQMKREFCKVNNIRLYEISYTENVEEECEKIISELSHDYMLIPCQASKEEGVTTIRKE